MPETLMLELPVWLVSLTEIPPELVNDCDE
jgi:hypothetical protein